MPEKTPKEGYAFKIELKEPEKGKGQQESQGEDLAKKMNRMLGMQPYQYFTRHIRPENGNLILEECFQFAVLTDQTRDIHVEYRLDVGDIHLNDSTLRIEEIAEASWMMLDEQEALLKLEEEKVKYPVGEHPDELMTKAALFQ
jgi:hypothetical protein